MQKKTISLCLFLSLLGCSTVTQLDTKPNIDTDTDNFKVSSKNVSSSAPRIPLDPSKIRPPGDSKGIMLKNNVSKPTQSFDILPPEGTVAREGSITVIFKNSAKVRVNKSDKKIYSLANTDVSQFEAILKKNGFVGGFDLGNYTPEDDNRLDQMQRNYSLENNNVDIPHLRSIHYYKVAKETDTKALSKEIMNLPYVRLAYPTPAVKQFTKTLVSNIPYHQTISNPSPDYYTNSGNPTINFANYYWHDEHESFRAKSYYRSHMLNYSQQNVTRPKLAIIDKGFDRGSDELNLSIGYKITDPWWSSPVVKLPTSSDCANNLCIVEPSDTKSHGHAVAYVAAAKNSNWPTTTVPLEYTSNGEGIAEGAQILPFNTDLATESINIAMSYARNDSTVDAINISLG